jgi:hypothetical protein
MVNNEDTPRELEAELEIWDWVRTAGVSADELLEMLRKALLAPDLRRAA